MEAHIGLPYFSEIVVFLAVAGVLTPILHRFKVSPVLGFLVAGLALGSSGLGRLAGQSEWISKIAILNADKIQAVAEFGIVLLLFVIGLELSFQRFWSMRKWVFGIGGLQVTLTTTVIGGAAYVFGNAAEVSFILGFCFALSSTALAVPLLMERRELASPMGRAAFSVLLFQDIAVVPLLILLPLMQQGMSGFVITVAIAFVKAIATIAVIIFIGRILLRPLLRHIAELRQPDSFFAVILLIVLLTGAATWNAGLSMALGAFLAGLLLAETEFRHEIELYINPLKGLLMGLFFMAVGMGINLAEIAREPVWIPLAVVGLILLKAGIIATIFRRFGLPLPRAIEAGLLLGQSGEFAFIIVALAMEQHLLSGAVGQFMLIVIGCSLIATPLVAAIASRFCRSLDEGAVVSTAPADVAEWRGHVIIAGFGRVGQAIAANFDQHGLSYVGLDHRPGVVANAGNHTMPVMYGDARHPDMLIKSGIDGAAALLVTTNDSAAAKRIVGAVRRLRPDLPIHARAHDEAHGQILTELGANHVVLETLEVSRELAERVRANLATVRLR